MRTILILLAGLAGIAAPAYANPYYQNYTYVVEKDEAGSACLLKYKTERDFWGARVRFDPKGVTFFAWNPEVPLEPDRSYDLKILGEKQSQKFPVATVKAVAGKARDGRLGIEFRMSPGEFERAFSQGWYTFVHTADDAKIIGLKTEFGRGAHFTWARQKADECRLSLR